MLVYKYCGVEFTERVSTRCFGSGFPAVDLQLFTESRDGCKQLIDYRGYLFYLNRHAKFLEWPEKEKTA